MVAVLNVVGRFDPFHCTVVVLMNCVPETKIVNAWLPAVIPDGNSPEICGVALIVVPPPQPASRHSASAAGTHRKRINLVFPRKRIKFDSIPARSPSTRIRELKERLALQGPNAIPRAGLNTNFQFQIPNFPFRFPFSFSICHSLNDVNFEKRRARFVISPRFKRASRSTPNCSTAKLPRTDPYTIAQRKVLSVIRPALAR